MVLNAQEHPPNQVDWADVPVEQARRGSRRDEFYPRLFNPSGDFIWYEPYLKDFPSAFEALDGTLTFSTYDRGLPTGVFVC